MEVAVRGGLLVIEVVKAGSVSFENAKIKVKGGLTGEAGLLISSI